MKKNKINISKFFIIILIIWMVFLNISQANAQGFGAGASLFSPEAIFQGIVEYQLKMDMGEVQYMTKSMNSARRKKTPPQVELYFNPANPELGEKVTATATPTYFLNDLKNIYYTWFLKPGHCPKQSDDIDSGEEDCDADLDGDIDIEDHKVRAMRIIVNGGLDTSLIDYSPASDDDDGYDAVWGGDDQKYKNAYCFMHDIKRGDEFEIACGGNDPDDSDGPEDHLFPDADGKIKRGSSFVSVNGKQTGDGKFDELEEEFWKTDTESKDTAHLGNNDEANVAGLGVQNFSWNYTEGDEVGVVIEGVSTENVQSDDSSYRIMFAATNGLCEDFNPGDEPSRSDIIDAINDKNPSWHLGEISPLSFLFTQVGFLVNAFTQLVGEPLDGVGITVESPTATPVFSGSPPMLTAVDITFTYAIRYYEDYVPVNQARVQEFKLDIVATVNILTGMVEDIDIKDHSTGSSILLSALSFAFIDPTNPQQLAQRLYDLKNYVNPTTIIVDLDLTGDPDYAKVSDLNKCLYDSFIEPSQMGDQSNRLDVTLSYSPLSPINDSDTSHAGSAITGDTIKLNTSIPNSKNPEYIKYDWTAYLTNSVDTTNLPAPLTKNELKESTQTSGLGINTFEFKMNFADGYKYLIVKVVAKENTGIDGNKYREGNDIVVIPINSSSNQILVHNMQPDSSLQINTVIDQICDADSQLSVCPVLKDQIIKVSIDNIGSLTDYAWTIDGKPFTYKECFFPECGGSSGNTEKQTTAAYFAVLKDPGKTYEIGLTALDSSNGKKVSLIRNFKVVEPKITITGEDNCNAFKLGSYIDKTGQPFEDFSTLNYWSIHGSQIKLGVKLVPENFSDIGNTAWDIDGNIITKTDNSTYPYADFSSGTSLLLDTKDTTTNELIKKSGQSYNISVNLLYYPSDLMKQALQKYWGVSYNQFYEKTSFDDMNITLYDSSPISSNGKNKKTYASIYSSIPAYLGFLLRIVLTISLILFVSRLVFYFFPKQKDYY